MASPITRIDGGTITNGTELIIPDLSLGCIKYEVELAGITVSGSQVDLLLATSIDNGTSYALGGDYTYRFELSSGSGGGQTNHYIAVGVTSASLIRAMGNDSGNFQSGVVKIYNPMDPGSKTVIITQSGGKINADGYSTNPNIETIMSTREATEANNAVKIFISSGTFSMKYVIYGYSA